MYESVVLVDLRVQFTSGIKGRRVDVLRVVPTRERVLYNILLTLLRLYASYLINILLRLYAADEALVSLNMPVNVV